MQDFDFKYRNRFVSCTIHYRFIHRIYPNFMTKDLRLELNLEPSHFRRHVDFQKVAFESLCWQGLNPKSEPAKGKTVLGVKIHEATGMYTSLCRVTWKYLFIGIRRLFRGSNVQEDPEVRACFQGNQDMQNFHNFPFESRNLSRRRWKISISEYLNKQALCLLESLASLNSMYLTTALTAGNGCSAYFSWH